MKIPAKFFAEQSGRAERKEYIWLVNTIRKAASERGQSQTCLSFAEREQARPKVKARRITFAEINEKWLQTDMSEGIELARSTFARHKDAIEDIFGIYIDCDRIITKPQTKTNKQ